jgi:hypothetical protein
MGRATQGVKLIRLEDDDHIADVTVVASSEEEVEQKSGPVDVEISDPEASEE